LIALVVHVHVGKLEDLSEAVLKDSNHFTAELERLALKTSDESKSIVRRFTPRLTALNEKIDKLADDGTESHAKAAVVVEELDQKYEDMHRVADERLANQVRKAYRTEQRDLCCIMSALSFCWSLSGLYLFTGLFAGLFLMMMMIDAACSSYQNGVLGELMSTTRSELMLQVHVQHNKTTHEKDRPLTCSFRSSV